MKPSNKQPGDHLRQKQLAQHFGMIEAMKKSILNKLVLVGISGQGIERTFVTGIEADLAPHVAVRLCAENKDDGMWFDMQTLKLFKVFGPEETEAWVKKYEEETKLKPA